MRKIDLVNIISDKTGIPKIDVLVTIESLVTEIKENMLKGENIYIRGFGSFINIKKAALSYLYKKTSAQDVFLFYQAV